MLVIILRKAKKNPFLFTFIIFLICVFILLLIAMAAAFSHRYTRVLGEPFRATVYCPNPDFLLAHKRYYGQRTYTAETESTSDVEGAPTLRVLWAGKAYKHQDISALTEWRVTTLTGKTLSDFTCTYSEPSPSQAKKLQLWPGVLDYASYPFHKAPRYYLSHDCIVSQPGAITCTFVAHTDAI